MKFVTSENMPNFETAKKMVSELSEKLKTLNVAYYQQSKSPVADESYDLMMRQLEALEAQYPELKTESSPTQRVGADLTGLFTKVKHHIPMLSISNVYNDGELSDWMNYINRNLEEEDISYVCELKIDGVAVAVRYLDGKLISAVTRGDGETGEDITQNIRTIQALPQILPEPVSFEVRGEIYFPKSKFNIFNRQREKEGLMAYKNPRNAASGCIRMKDPEEVAQRQLDIFMYDIVDGLRAETHFENLTRMGEWGLPATPNAQKVRQPEEILAYCREWEIKKERLDFDIDGVVIKVNRLKDRQILGTRAKSPRWVVAWKFTAQRAETKLLGIENSVGRTGVITPVALLEPAALLGTVVKRATLHNYEQIARLDIRIGDSLYIEKGGEIIPKVIAVNLLKRSVDSMPVLPPVECPGCQTPVVSQSPIEIKCVNPDCRDKILGELKYFVSRNALDINHLGPAVLEKLLEHKLIKDKIDIFSLSDYAETIKQWDGFGERSAENILAAVNDARQKPLNRFINAFGIANIGEKASKTLAQHVKNFNGLLCASHDGLKSLPDFGDIMIQSVVDWVSAEANRKMLTRLMLMGIDPVFEATGTQQLKNETVVITGKLSKPRQNWKMMLENEGYRVSDSISAKTSYLLTGDQSGQKLEKAKKLGVTIISEEDMLAMIQNTG